VLVIRAAANRAGEMDVVSGVTIGTRYRRPRRQEFRRFPDEIDATLLRGFALHLVVDNHGTHKVANVRSWLNLVERLFGEVTERCVRRGSHTAVRALESQARLFGASQSEFQALRPDR
jgi:hypothetical protein